MEIAAKTSWLVIGLVGGIYKLGVMGLVFAVGPDLFSYLYFSLGVRVRFIMGSVGFWVSCSTWPHRFVLRTLGGTGVLFLSVIVEDSPAVENLVVYYIMGVMMSVVVMSYFNLAGLRKLVNKLLYILVLVNTPLSLSTLVKVVVMSHLFVHLYSTICCYTLFRVREQVYFSTLLFNFGDGKPSHSDKLK